MFGDDEKMKPEDVKVKISSCNKCLGTVRVSVVHQMTTKIKNQFAKEVMENNLSVNEIPLLEFRKQKQNWCECL
tara:strand:- start:2927 stop:3148 length:222 start_codon:yes stop_codon:yes gene_type:complete